MFETQNQNLPSPAEVNERFFEWIGGSDGMKKKAGDALQDYTRDRLREESFVESILPPISVDNNDLDTQLDTDKPVIIQFKEPGSPGAVSLPYGQLPYNEYIMGPKYAISFDRIVTPKFTADVDTLRTYTDIDIRQVLSDNGVKDMSAEQDAKFLGGVNHMLSNGTYASGATVTSTGAVQWQDIAGGFSRETISEAKTVMMKTRSRFAPVKALCNMITWTRFEAFGRDEAGGDIAEEVFINGFTERRIGGIDYVVTIKRELVPDDTIYWFSAPKNFGKFCVLEDTTMFVKKEAWFIEFFQYKNIGGSIGNIAGAARTDFQTS